MQKTLPTLTVNQVRDEFCQNIPADHIDTVGVWLEKDPRLPELDIQFEEGTRNLMLVLELNPDHAGESKYIQFDAPLPITCVPDAVMSVRDLFDEAGCSESELVKDAMLTLIKRAIRLRIYRPLAHETEVELELSIGGFRSGAKCDIHELAHLISSRRETRLEEENRLENEYWT